MARVVVYTAPGCHLCGPAVEAVRAVCGEAFGLVDISTDRELERAYRRRIPVVEVDGVERRAAEMTPGRREDDDATHVSFYG